MADQTTVVNWLNENGLAPVLTPTPKSSWAFTFKMPSGLQLLVQQPAGRSDLFVVSCGLNVEPAQKAGLQKSKEDFLWTIRRDFLLKGLVFQFTPPDEGKIPNSIGVAVELYNDGISKNVFMKGVLSVHEGALLLILTIRRFLTGQRPEGYA